MLRPRLIKIWKFDECWDRDSIETLADLWARSRVTLLQGEKDLNEQALATIKAASIHKIIIFFSSNLLALPQHSSFQNLEPDGWKQMEVLCSSLHSYLGKWIRHLNFVFMLLSLWYYINMKYTRGKVKFYIIFSFVILYNLSTLCQEDQIFTKLLI